MNLKDFMLQVLNNKNVDSPKGMGYKFMRLTPSRVALVVWNDYDKIKSQISLMKTETEMSVSNWENLKPDYKWIVI